MNLKVVLAAVIFAAPLAGIATSAAYSAPKQKPAAAGKFTTGEKRQVFRKPDGSYGGKNVATAFTTFCYAQFGPKAKYPDADLLQKCLSK